MPDHRPDYGADSGSRLDVDNVSLFVVRLFDGIFPTRAALIIPARTKYEAEILAGEWFEEEKGVRLEDTDLDVSEAMEEDRYPGVYRI